MSGLGRLAGALLAAAGLAGCGRDASHGIEVPDGFRVTTAASGVGRPTNIAFDRRGGLWTTSGGYAPARSDGAWFTARRGAPPVHAIADVRAALGLTWFRGELFVTHIARAGGRTVGRITAYSNFDGRRFRRSRTVLDGLPTGLHQIDSVVAGPAGRLYVGIGAVAEARRGPNPLSASVVSFLPSGRGVRVEARGLRNPYGLAFVPGTSHVLVSDNGRDLLGQDVPPDELNLVDVARPPRDYGFPGCWEQGGRACRGTAGALARLAPHSAAGGVALAPRLGRFGRSAFVAENGSTIRRRLSGNIVVRVALRRAGGSYRATVHPFARGFAHNDPVGIAIGPDGAVYVTLHNSGQVVRIAPRHAVQGSSTRR